MRRVTVQLDSRVSQDDEHTPIVVSIEDTGDAHPEWCETATRIAGDEAARLFGLVAVAQEDDTEPPP